MPKPARPVRPRATVYMPVWRRVAWVRCQGRWRRFSTLDAARDYALQHGYAGIQVHVGEPQHGQATEKRV